MFIVARPPHLAPTCNTGALLTRLAACRVDALGMPMHMNVSSTDQLQSSSRKTVDVQHRERGSQSAQVLTARMAPVDSADQNSAIQPITGEAEKTESAASHLQELLDRTRHLQGAASQ